MVSLALVALLTWIIFCRRSLVELTSILPSLNMCQPFSAALTSTAMVQSHFKSFVMDCAAWRLLLMITKLRRYSIVLMPIMMAKCLKMNYLKLSQAWMEDPSVMKLAQPTSIALFWGLPQGQKKLELLRISLSPSSKSLMWTRTELFHYKNFMMDYFRWMSALVTWKFVNYSNILMPIMTDQSLIMNCTLRFA